MVKITFSGSDKDIQKASKILKKYKLTRKKEPEVRRKIQSIIDEHNLKATILVNGNIVWSKKRIINNLRRIMKVGTLYNPDQSKPPILSHYFYQFLHQVCGSIAHYDIHGWIHKYPTVEHLRKFFKRNEFGKRVLDWIPEWKTDARHIVEQIEVLLFPFQTYMESRKPKGEKS